MPEVKPLDPQTDTLVWQLAERISDLPTRDQIYATIVAVPVLLAEQSEDTVSRVFAGVRELMKSYQSSADFKKRLS